MSTAGRTIALKANQSLTLGYMKSCTREVIAGGRVTIGQEQSVVEGGKVERSQVRCNGGGLKLTSEQASKSGGMVFRKPPSPNVPIDVMIYGLSPVVELAAGATATIDRIDAASTQIVLTPNEAQLRGGKFLDLAREDKILSAGGVYRLTRGDKQLVFGRWIRRRAAGQRRWSGVCCVSSPAIAIPACAAVTSSPSPGLLSRSARR